MSELTNENVHQRVEQYVQERQGWMQDAVEVMGVSRDTDPLTVFPAPTEVRDDADSLSLSEEQEVALREIAGRFGVGGEVDVKTQAQHQILEGGKPWKIEAEAAISSEAETIIYAGSPHRVVGQDERDYLASKYETELPEQLSEYDAAILIAVNQPDYDGTKVRQLPFSYDIHNGHVLVEEATGQLMQIGTENGRPVLVLRVDRENYEDEEGNKKYRNQPDSAALMGFVADVLTATGDETSSVGLNTSNTYASRAIDAVRAGLKKNRVFDVGMYGRTTVRELGAPNIPVQTPINQIPGELHAIYGKLVLLQNEL